MVKYKKQEGCGYVSCIRTYTGAMFDPTSPDTDLIRIEDIAHALSMLCRANGHFTSFYSVGQHSINCMKEAAARGYSRNIQLACLLHDASEAYLADVTRPVKAHLPRYLEIEAPLQEMIWSKWLDTPLDERERELVFQIDDAILAHEFISLIGVPLGDVLPEVRSIPEFGFTGFETCEREFLVLYHRLMADLDVLFTVGIDWMSPLWLAVELRSTDITYRKFLGIRQACEAYADADAVLIDIPIGLPESQEQDLQRPDKVARTLLPAKRKPSVFPVPCRQAVYAQTEGEANELNRAILARGLSKQALAFSGMIRQVDEYLEQSPEWKNRLLESHPEVAFQMLNGGNGLSHAKKTAEGQEERVRILRRCGIDPCPFLSQFKTDDQNDFLDALCLALSAQVGLQNGFIRIPEFPQKDSRGLTMQMVFGNAMGKDQNDRKQMIFLK